MNSLIVNPAFKSQTKEALNTNVPDFGSRCELNDKFVKKMMKLSIVEQIIFMYKARQDALMKKTLRGTKRARITGYDKLEDANKAGGAEGHKCTLIVTEGDSAKSLAMAGIEMIGRDYFGVFPLKGKLLNVRDSSATKIMQNQEIQAVIKIMGLQMKE